MAAIQLFKVTAPLTRKIAPSTAHHEDIRDRSGKRHDDRGSAWVAQRAQGHGHRSGPAEQRQTKSQQQPGNEHGADRVDMAKGVQTQAAEELGGAIAEVSGCPAVRHFVQCNGIQNRDCPDRNLVKKRSKIQ
jgi:hypothetical protein